MNHRWAIALLAVFAGLSVAYWGMLRYEERGRQAAHDAGRVFDVSAQSLHEISIQVEDRRPTVGVTDGDGRWRITAPYALKGQDEVWNRLAANLVELHRERIIEERPRDLAPYELDDPRLQVEFTKADGAVHRVIFGKVGPMQVNRYAQIDGGAVVLVPDAQYAHLNRELLDLRQRYIFDVGYEGITRIEFARIRQPDPDAPKPEGSYPMDEIGVVVVEQTDEHTWRMLEPFEATANAALVQGLANELQFAVGHDYVDAPEDLDDFFLNPPGARITVYSEEDSEPQTLYIGGGTMDRDRKMLFAKRADEPAVFQIDGALYGFFPKTPDAYRENRLLTRSAMDLERIHYRRDDVDLTLVQDDTKRWRLADPVDEPADQEMVSAIISTLLKVRGESFPPISMVDAGLADPAITLRLAFEGDDAPVVIRIGHVTDDGNAHYATLDTGVITLVPAPHVRMITRDLFDFREKRIFECEPGAVTRIHLHFDGTDYVFAKGRRWTVERPGEKIWDSQDDARALVEAVARVDASGMEVMEAPDDLAPYGLDEPLVTLTVEMADGGETRTAGPFRIGEPVPEQSYLRFAALEGRSEIFHVNQVIVDNLREALKGVRDR